MTALRRFRADLHIHTCLSPCGELDMYPRLVVERALDAGLDMIAVTDHNTADNAAAVVRAAEGKGLTVFPGMEIASEEDVHVLGIFAAMDAIGPFARLIADGLPDVEGRRSYVDDQVLVDENDIVLGFHPRFLAGSVSLSVFEIVRRIRDHGGLAIASHVDRESFSLISQLGFVPEDLDLDALEVSPHGTPAAVRGALVLPPGIPLVTFSDAHRPEEIGRRMTDFLLDSPRLEEIRKALRGVDGRKIIEA